MPHKQTAVILVEFQSSEVEKSEIKRSENGVMELGDGVSLCCYSTAFASLSRSCISLLLAVLCLVAS
ncbi:hypothetical protein HN51_041490, partial [Arachis hypogaea]